MLDVTSRRLDSKESQKMACRHEWFDSGLECDLARHLLAHHARRLPNSPVRLPDSASLTHRNSEAMAEGRANRLSVTGDARIHFYGRPPGSIPSPDEILEQIEKAFQPPP